MNAAGLLLLACALTTPAFARLGDTRDQALQRYGAPKQTEPPKYGAPLLEGAKELTFEYKGWRIRCALLMATDGVSYVVREEYSKLLKPNVSLQVSEDERKAILEGEGGLANWAGQKPGLQLLPKPVCGLIGTSWVRAADSAVAVLALGGAPFRFELPQASKYEQEMKAIKAQQTKAAVPTF